MKRLLEVRVRFFDRVEIPRSNWILNELWNQKETQNEWEITKQRDFFLIILFLQKKFHAI
jgi:hypothetical protein